MMEWLKIVYAPFVPFVWHPERIAIVAGIFFVAFIVTQRHFRAWPFLVAAIAWAVLVPWEYYCKVQEANIRVDLLLIWPLLLIITGWSLIAGFRMSEK